MVRAGVDPRDLPTRRAVAALAAWGHGAVVGAALLPLFAAFLHVVIADTTDITRVHQQVQRVVPTDPQTILTLVEDFALSYGYRRPESRPCIARQQWRRALFPQLGQQVAPLTVLATEDARNLTTIVVTAWPRHGGLDTSRGLLEFIEQTLAATHKGM